MRKLATLLSLSSLLIAMPAIGGITDFINGVTVGRSLPEHEFSYLVAEPLDNPKLKLVDFWATWCAGCRTSIVQINGIHEKYAGRGLQVLGVTKEAKEVVSPFLQKLAFKYPVAIDIGAKLHTALKVKALPYAIFVGKSGKIVWRGQPEEITDELIESLLSKENS